MFIFFGTLHNADYSHNSAGKFSNENIWRKANRMTVLDNTCRNITIIYMIWQYAEKIKYSIK